MPEIINNVTTGAGLLHEVMHETIKQSLVSSGFPLYEYDPTTEKFRDTVSGQELEYEVRFPHLFSLGSDRTGDIIRTVVSMVGDLTDPELIPLADHYEYFDNYGTNYLVNFNVLRYRPEDGSISSRLNSNTSAFYSSGRTWYFYTNSLLLNPEPGYVINVALGIFSSPGPRIFVHLFNYNFSSNTLSRTSSIQINFFPTSGTNSIYSFLASKAYKYETSTNVFYSVFLGVYEEPSYKRKLILVILNYNKTNKTLSASSILVNDDLDAYINPQNWLSDGNQWTSVSAFHGYFFRYPNGGVYSHLGMKESLSVVSDPSDIRGNVLVFLKKVGLETDKSLIIKIPFSLSLNTSNPGSSSVTLSGRDDWKVYGPLSLTSAFHNGYMSEDLQRMEFPRRATYSPPSNYRFKVEEFKHIRYNNSLITINNDIDTEDRMSISVFLYSYNDPTSQTERGVYVNPTMVINSLELTPGGGVYFTGFTPVTHASVMRYFLLSKYHPDLMCLSVIGAENPRDSSGNNGRPYANFYYYVASFSRKTTTNDYSSSLEARNKQPYLAKIVSPKIYSYYYDRTLSDNQKTVFSRKDHVFLTSIMWTNHYADGFFVPVFFLVKPGGDGVWFKPDTIYLGIGSYASTEFPPHHAFMINGSVVEYLWPELNNRVYYGEQVNSTISLVFRFIVSKEKSVISMIGSQGSNVLRFASFLFFDISEDSDRLFGLYFPFGNIYHFPTNRPGVIPHANIPSREGSLSFQPGSRGLWPNAYIGLPSHGRPYFYWSRRGTQRSIRYSWNVFTDTQNTVESPRTVTVFGYLHPDLGINGIIPTPVLTPADPLDFIVSIDKSNTVTLGDYLFLTDPQGNQLRYVVVNTEGISVYPHPDATSTSNRRALFAVRVQ